jgi:SOS-response transcriptional repressor LexA
MDAPEKSQRERQLDEASRMRRPVALLSLIHELETFEVTDDLILAVVEAVEGGIDIDHIFETQVTEIVEETEEEEEEAAPEIQSATPIPIYRIGESARLYFAADGSPVGPPAHHIYLSRLKFKQVFGCELRGEEMLGQAYPRFKRGDILLFSPEPRIESGDLVFAKTRHSDEFVQVFFGQEDLVRLRPLNGQYAERSLRRSEVKLMYRLVGRYEDF